MQIYCAVQSHGQAAGQRDKSFKMWSTGIWMHPEKRIQSIRDVLTTTVSQNETGAENKGVILHVLWVKLISENTE